ncbi:DUF742 domain-containing protein [Streptomyces sp. NPDC000594]|uniref:DUF742 domain-containing protein n=1 Tax=Streptomyces sp. NPDC000594 TaxID=3154261 RepID=UPI00332BEA29
MATPPGGHPYDGAAHRRPEERSRHRYGFPPAPEGNGGTPPYEQYENPSSEQYGQHQQHQQYQRYDEYEEYGQQQHQPPPSSYEQRPYDRQPPYDQRDRRAAEPSPVQNAHNPLVRPYAMTGGRTRPRYQLAIEALVSTTADPMSLHGQLPEHQRICRLCIEIKSVAEISALLHIPLGVARILVADLAEAGLVAIHQPGGDEAAGGQPDVTLLERVLSGLRKL